MTVKGRSEKSSVVEHLAYVLLIILSENDGKMLLSELVKELEKREGDKIPPELRERYDDGQIKWQTRMKFAANLFVKKGYIQKRKGMWHITPEGERALTSKSEDKLIADAKKHFNELSKKRKHLQAVKDADASVADSDVDGEGTRDADAEAKDRIDAYESEAKTAIKEHIDSLGAYEFQELCAALLRGMGYYIRHVAAPGPDGGIDIVAYNDPLGGGPPRINVQVKHLTSGQKVSDSVLKQLAGSLRRDGDIGVLITSSDFTRDCKKEARAQQKHIELIDFERFVELWVEHYDQLPEEDKLMLPLQPIYFLAPRSN